MVEGSVDMITAGTQLQQTLPSSPPSRTSATVTNLGTTNQQLFCFPGDSLKGGLPHCLFQRYGFLGLPGYLGGKPIQDEETKKKKLNAELANGRLAMMAIIGMFFQDT